MVDIVHKLLTLLDHRARVNLVLLLAFLVIVAAVEMAGIASIMPFMAVVTNPAIIHTNRWLQEVFAAFDFASDRDFLIFLGVLVLVLLLFSNAIKALSSWLLLRYLNRIFFTLSRSLLAHYLARPYSFFLSHNTSQLGSNILTEARNVVVMVLSPGMTAVSSLLVSLAIMILLIAVDPTVALAIGSVLAGAYGLIYFFARRKLEIIGKQQVEANAQKYKIAGEAMSGIKELKVLGNEWTFLQEFSRHAERHSANNVAAGVISEMPRYGLEVVAFGGILVVVLYLLSKGQGAAELVPLVSLYAFAGYRLLPALQQLFASVSLFKVGTAALETLHKDLTDGASGSTRPEVELRASTSVKPMPFSDTLELLNVSFKYDGAVEHAIHELNISIKHNTTIGLVGPTGCGKTTTVDLILGLLQPCDGQLLVDGVPVTRDNLRSWQKNIGYVPQQIFICDGTVTKNIAFGVPDADINMDTVRRAARIANLEEFVDAELPYGFDTVVGERGVRLSGGQRQRIGIARALYHDPEILIMDEATSALDGITEEHVMHAVRALSKKKTIVLIAHRLTTVKECDIIYILDKGSVTSSGQYDDLIAESHWFRTASKT